MALMPPAGAWQDGGPGQKKEGGGRVAFSFQTWCSHPSGADGTGRDLGIQASGQRQLSHELTLTAKEPPGPLAGLSTISRAPAGQSPKSYALSIWPTRVGSDGSEVQPRRAGGPWYRPETRAQTEARRLWAPGWGEGKDRWDRRHDMGRATLPPFPQRNKRRAKDRVLGRCQH